jgi:hypothetical protein
VAALLKRDRDDLRLTAETDDLLLEAGEQLGQFSWMMTPRMFWPEARSA